MDKKQTRILSAAILLFGLLWIFASARPSTGEAAAPLSAPEPGLLAPGFTIETMAGEQYSIAGLRGKVVVLNFWASWCGPCRAEMPAIQKIFEEYEEKDLVILAVNSTVQDSVSDAEAFVAEFNLTFPILMDYDGAVSRMYRLSALPTTFFIGRDGIIVKISIGGPMSESQLRLQIESLLGEAH